MTAPVRPDTDRAIDALLTRYPGRGSALLPALYLIQDEIGFVSEESMSYVAEKIDVSPAFVAGVVSFYSMFYRRPVGRHHSQVGRTLPCAMRGSRSVPDPRKTRLGIREGETTPDGRFSLVEVECLGACDAAPMCQINDQDHFHLDEKKLDALLDSLE